MHNKQQRTLLSAVERDSASQNLVLINSDVIDDVIDDVTNIDSTHIFMLL